MSESMWLLWGFVIGMTWFLSRDIRKLERRVEALEERLKVEESDANAQ